MKLDNTALIQQFVQGKLTFAANQNLRIETAADMAQLLTKYGNLLATIQLDGLLPSILVRRESNYWELINQILLENSFISTGKLERGLMRYDYYPAPDGYKINYTEARLLWKTWRNQFDKNTNTVPRELLIFTLDGWQVAKNIVISQDNLFIQTWTDELVVDTADKLVWLDSIN